MRGLTIPYEVRENYFWGVLVNVLARLENEDSYKSMLEVVDCYMVEFFRSGQVVYFSDVSKEKGRGAYLDFVRYLCGYEGLSREERMIIMGWRYCVGCLHVYGFVNSFGVVDRGLFVSDGGIMSNVVRCVGDIYTGYGDVYIRGGEGYGFDNYGAVKLRGLTIPYEVRENYFGGCW